MWLWFWSAILWSVPRTAFVSPKHAQGAVTLIRHLCSAPREWYSRCNNLPEHLTVMSQVRGSNQLSLHCMPAPPLTNFTSKRESGRFSIHVKSVADWLTEEDTVRSLVASSCFPVCLRAHPTRSHPIPAISDRPFLVVSVSSSKMDF